MMLMAHNKAIFFVALIFFIGLYIIGMVLTASKIKSDITYATFNRGKFAMDGALRIILEWSRVVVTFGSILFPLYWCFVFGSAFGYRMYNELIQNNDENRLASWVL